MKENWVKVFTADNEYSVEIVQGLLKDNGIEAIIMNKKDNEFLLGVVELYVEEKDLALTQELLASHSSQ